MLYFFTRPYTYEADAVVSSANGNDVVGHLPAEAIDNNKDTYWENDGATPDYIIDLGAAYDINCLWFKHYNIDTFDLSYSDNGIAWTAEATTNRIAKSASIFWQFQFTLRTKRYWKISVTAKLGAGNVYLYEVMLMQYRQYLDEDLAPKMVIMTPQDAIGGSYRMADGSEKSYSGGRLHANIKMEFEYTDATTRDLIYALYSTPTLRPPVTILPDDNYPENIFRCIWKNPDFPFKYTIPYTGSGFSGNLEFQEY